MKLLICLAVLALSLATMHAWADENNFSSIPYGARVIKTGMGLTSGFYNQDNDAPYYYTSSYYSDYHRHGYRYGHHHYRHHKDIDID